MGRTEGKNGSFVSHKDENLSKFFFFHYSLVNDQGPESMPKFLIVMCIRGIFATVIVLRGTRWVP